MIVVDTSAVVAILEQEPEADRFAAAIEADAAPVMSAATFIELNAVMKHRRGEPAIAMDYRFIDVAGIEIEPLTAGQAIIARDAYSRYPSLNLGNSFAYALAKYLGAPLLFKGHDFRKTGLDSVL